VVVGVYSYDAVGRRTRSVSTIGPITTTRDYGLDGGEEIEERDGTGAPQQQYVYGASVDEPLVLDRHLSGVGGPGDPLEDRLFYHANTLGSVFALTDLSGNIVEGYQYDAYGRQTVYDPGTASYVTFTGADTIVDGGTSAVANPYLFTGRRLDGESALYYYRARYLDPVQGRFIGRDPVEYEAGDSNL
jgi:RHS repeat-associated protein